VRCDAYHREKFTVILLSYKRPNVLLHTLKHLNGAPSIQKVFVFDYVVLFVCASGFETFQVIVVWNDVSSHPNASFFLSNTSYELEYFEPGRNSLLNRFLPLNVTTSAIFSSDDDIRIDHASLVCKEIIPFLVHCANTCRNLLSPSGSAFPRRLLVFLPEGTSGQPKV
jgi:hypothetical protein